MKNNQIKSLKELFLENNNPVIVEIQDEYFGETITIMVKDHKGKDFPWKRYPLKVKFKDKSFVLLFNTKCKKLIENDFIDNYHGFFKSLGLSKKKIKISKQNVSMYQEYDVCFLTENGTEYKGSNYKTNRGGI